MKDLPLIESLKNTALHYLIRIPSKKIITAYDEFCPRNTSKRALLSYLVLPLLPPSRFRDRVKFSNRGIAQEIPRALNELGFKVDIINFDNLSWEPKRDYELFVGHGGINYEWLSRRLPEITKRIYFSTGLYWKEWNIRMAKRLYDITFRRASLLPPERFIRYPEEYANHNADGIICLGNQEVAKTYGMFPKVIAINNAIYPNNSGNELDKDFDEGRNHFLFFSGRGNVHKGLDLLLEAFAQTDLHLHICQHMQVDFVNLYYSELTKFPNIHLNGFVKMRSRGFQMQAKQCNWIISASCAEGQPGAILECMGYGLIPILSESNNIDMGHWGLSLKDCTIETIRDTVIQASLTDVNECRIQCQRVIKATKEIYSIENFRAAFIQAVKEIVFSKNSTIGGVLDSKT